MRASILFLLLCWQTAFADWKADVKWYWFTGPTPAVAVTSSNIVNVFHATGSVSSVSIGDITGPLPGLCTGFVTDGVCGGSVANCTWTHHHNNEYNDAYLFYTCRPMTEGITYVATNLVVGRKVTWWSRVDEVWYDGTITFAFEEGLHSFPDGESAWYGLFVFDGHQAVSGDSGSPCYTTNGDYAGTVSGQSGSQTRVKYLFPSGARHRPPPDAAAGLAGLFNGDPDK